MPTKFLGPVHEGVQIGLIDEAPSAAGTTTVEFSVETDSVLITLYVASVTGALDVAVFGLAETHAAPLFSFPQISSPTTDLLLRRASITTSRVRVVVTYTGACEYQVHGRAVDAGLSDARIISASGFSVTVTPVTAVPALLIPASLDDRAGLVIKNWSSIGNLFVGPTSAVTTADGYPLAPRDALAIDLASGAAIYGVSDGGTLDVRIAENGG